MKPAGHEASENPAAREMIAHHHWEVGEATFRLDFWRQLDAAKGSPAIRAGIVMVGPTGRRSWHTLPGPVGVAFAEIIGLAGPLGVVGGE